MTASTQGGAPGTSAKKTPLHRVIYEALEEKIRQGGYRNGDRLPSESDLCKQFRASRITVGKAMQALQQDGLVVRRPGSGSYIHLPAAATTYQFGLLIPELGRTEVFEPICQGIMHSPQAKSHSLIWGHSPRATIAGDEAALALCQQFIAQRVSGVFFAPLEYSERRDLVNHQIVTDLRNAGIPVVLLDRCCLPYPHRSDLDRVGIDNYRASFIVTQHLWRQGARRIIFLARNHSASTISERACGYLFALRECGSEYRGNVTYFDELNETFFRKVQEKESPDAIVCGNDTTAAHLMRLMITLGIRVPDQIRMASFDDVNYAKFLPVPLTTIHQNCAQIGEAAISAMFARMADPERPGLDINVPFKLIVRESCGAPIGARMSPSPGFP